MNYAWHEFEFSPPGVSVEHPSLRHFANITNMFTVKSNNVIFIEINIH